MGQLPTDPYPWPSLIIVIAPLLLMTWVHLQLGQYARILLPLDNIVE